MIPGANVLARAFRIIAQQTVIYYRTLGRTLNPVGQEITQYATGVAVTGSFQPVPRKLYTQFGLDLQKSYFTFYVSKELIDTARNTAGDQIAYDGQRYQCESSVAWFNIDGWESMLCVHIGLDIAAAPLWGFGTMPVSNTYFNFNNGNFIATWIL